MRIIIFCLLFNFQLTGFCQTLRVGDKCPELLFENIMNSSTGAEKLSGQKGKLVLLDFGSTDCIPCRYLLPKLDSFQNEFKTNLKVFMITKEKKERVAKFLANKVGKQVKVPFIVEDSSLNALFPHFALPHEVWIGPDGYIIAITNHEYVTRKNIEFVLNGGRPNWPEKVEMEYDPSTSLLEYSKSHGIQTINSTMTGYIEGVTRRGWSDKGDSSYKGVIYINYTLMDMYLTVYRKSIYSFYRSQLLIDPSIEEQFFYKASAGHFEEWRQKNSYCYELSSTTPISKRSVYERMKMDLDYYFALRSSLENRKRQCLIMNGIGDHKSAEGKKGESISSIISYVNRSGEFPLFINETGLSDKELQKIYIDIDKALLKDKGKLFEVFKHYGFNITEEEREIEVLEIIRK